MLGYRRNLNVLVLRPDSRRAPRRRPTSPRVPAMMHASPRKVVPLNDVDSDRERPARTADGPASVTRRAFFCGVVVETDPDGRDISQGI